MPSEKHEESRSRVGTPKDSSSDVGTKRAPPSMVVADMGSSSGSIPPGSKTPKPAAKNANAHGKKPAKKVLRLENVLPDMASYDVSSVSTSR